MSVGQAQVLVLGTPGRMQESLRTLLQSVRELEALDPGAGHWPSPRYSSEKIHVVVLDLGRPEGDMPRDLAWLKANWPLTRCLVLADTALQLRLALSAGADAALLKGFTAGELFATLKDLLKGKVDPPFELAVPGGGRAEASASDARPAGHGPCQTDAGVL